MAVHIDRIVSEVVAAPESAGTEAGRDAAGLGDTDRRGGSRTAPTCASAARDAARTAAEGFDD